MGPRASCAASHVVWADVEEACVLVSAKPLVLDSSASSVAFPLSVSVAGHQRCAKMPTIVVVFGESVGDVSGMAVRVQQCALPITDERASSSCRL